MASPNPLAFWFLVGLSQEEGLVRDWWKEEGEIRSFLPALRPCHSSVFWSSVGSPPVRLQLLLGSHNVSALLEERPPCSFLET